MKTVKILIFVFLFAFAGTAHARIYIPVDQPSDQRFPIAICDLEYKSTSHSNSKGIADVIRNDMTISGYFNVLPKESVEDAAKREGITKDDIRFDYWRSIDALALVKGRIEKDEGDFVIKLSLFDPLLGTELVTKEYRSSKDALRKVAHTFSDEIMLALTGIPGVFNTKMTYTVPIKNKYKQIGIMDMDGYNNYVITKNKTINISPAWSPDGGSIAFTSYADGTPQIYIANLANGGLRKLTSNSRTNLTPAWSPDGGSILFASSNDGDFHIFMTNPNNKENTKITNSKGIDISPSWAPGGGSFVFASDRTGKLHIYSGSVSGGNSSRLTFVGYQNDMPAWSPVGDKIAFAGRDMGTFDIFIMNSNGSNIQRLTADTGSNEHPSWSPDGRWIAFSSTREKGSAIYIMRADGSNQVRVSEGNGLLPEWGPMPKNK